MIEEYGDYTIVVAANGRMFTAKVVPTAKVTLIQRGPTPVAEFDEFDVVQRASRAAPSAAVNAAKLLIAH